MTASWVNRKPSAIQVSKHRPTFKRLLDRVDLYQFCSDTMILFVLFVLFVFYLYLYLHLKAHISGLVLLYVV